MIDLKNSSLDFKINLRVHFSRDNADIVGDLMDDIKENFGGDIRFRCFFKPIVPLGGKNDAGLNCFSDQEAFKFIQGLRVRLGNHVNTLLNEDTSYICYAGRPTSIVIRPGGRLAKCTIGLDEVENQIGHIRTNGILEIDQAEIRRWLKGAVSLDREILRCPRAFM